MQALQLAPIAVTPAQAATPYCQLDGVRFASCPGTTRLFGAVVVAIPGWNGTCFDSFGVAESSLLNVMRQVNFFDIDCFDYDSHHVSLEDNAKLLLVRLQGLADAGYEEVTLLTHSTGGILALQLILTELTKDNVAAVRLGPNQSLLFGRQGEGLKLVALHAFGTPINGVRDHICAAGRLGNIISISPAILPYLCADSEVLSKLKESFERFNQLHSQLSSADRNKFRFSLNFFQGQGDDWVVNDIHPGQRWFPANADVHLVSTLRGHTVVVGQNGTLEFPTFSGEVMSDKSQLLFSLLPRTRTYFHDGLAPSATLDWSQRTIVGGVVDFAGIRNLFAAGAKKVSEFVVLIFNGRFVRDRGFDEYAVGQLDELLRQRADTLAPSHIVRYGDQLLADIEIGYVEPNPTDPLMFGAESEAAGRKLARTVQYVFETVSLFVGDTPALENELLSSQRSLAEFERRVDRVLARFLTDTDIDTQSAAVEAYNSFAQTASLKALETIDFSQSLGVFATTNYRIMSADRKNALGDVFTKLGDRSEVVASDLLDILNSKQPWLGEDSPLWVPLLTEEQTKFWIDKSSVDQSEAASEFLTSVVANAGRFGQSYTIAFPAIKSYDTYMTGLPTSEQSEKRDLFEQAIGSNPYPVVQLEGYEMLEKYEAR